MVYETCPRCGTTVKLTNDAGGKNGYYWGKCSHCGNKVIKQK